MAARTRLGEVLIDRGLLAATQLDAALAEQSTSREPLGRILVRRGLIDRGQLAAALKEQSRRWLAAGITASFLAAYPGVAAARMTTAPLTVSVEVLGRATVGVDPAAAQNALTVTCGSSAPLRVTYDSTALEPAAAAGTSPYVPTNPYKLSLQPIATTVVTCGRSGETLGLAPPQGAAHNANLSVEIAY